MRISRRVFLGTGVAGGLGLAAAGTYGFAYESRRVTLTRADVTVPGLPPALDGARIGILTDLHHSALVPASLIGDAARLLMAERPDFIALLGDYASWADRAYVGGCVEALAPLSAPSGVFAIVGNHDDERIMLRALTARGIEVLLDARTEVRIRGESIGLAGIRFWPKKANDVRSVVTGARHPTVLLAHDPRRLAEAAALGVPLMLSGHTHGGQVALPGLGAPAARKYPIAQGVMRQGNTTLFVSRGVGTVLVPIRLNCPPEAAVVTLRCVPA